MQRPHQATGRVEDAQRHARWLGQREQQSVPSVARNGKIFVRQNCPAVGACCLPDGSCTMVTGTQCAALDGDFRGYDEDCSPNPCPQRGACCIDETCQLLLQAECNDLAGVWHPEWTSCGPPDPCVQEHVCCVFGECHLILESECGAMQGDWRPDLSSCAPNPCPQPAACCVMGECRFLLEESCNEISGHWHPEWLECGPTTCEYQDAPAPTIPDRVSLSEPVPNPFCSVTFIEFTMPRAGRARIEILDATGRRVRTLRDAFASPGPARVTWDGCDGDGRPMPSGAYFCRLTAHATTNTQHVVLLR